MAPPAHFRIQGWDPLLIILQIVAYQSFHYLAVSLLLPILLLFFADPTALAVEGGAANVAMVMDWREFLSAGSFGLVYDSARAYVVASSWFTASFIDITFLYYIVRKPASILDFSLTLLLNHVVLTTYYAAAFPSSLFFWLIIIFSSIVQIVIAEQLCIRRELQTSFDFDSSSTFASYVFPWSVSDNSRYHQISPNEDAIPLTERHSSSQPT